MRKFFTITLIAVLLTSLITELSAQENVAITGKVTDASNSEPLIGVTVQLKGTTSGTITDVDGNYSINAPSNASLIFSFIGYKTQEVNIGNKTTINIQLSPDVEALSEVVVVGYGTQKKSDVTGSTANVKGEELAKQPVLTATQALQGKVAGVQIIGSGQPGSSPQIRVRGVGTAIAGTTVLYVVDGVLTDDISNINTADIVDMNVLKDASAAAIYGSRGANGVVIITTKKGEKGNIKVNYNNNVGIRQAANLVEMANSAEYSNYLQAATGNAAPATSYNTNWYDAILRNAWYHNHNVSISGGTEKSTYFVNVGYFYDQGIILRNSFKRLTARINEEYRITNKIKVGIMSSYSNGINQNSFNILDIDQYGKVGSVYNDAYRAAPIIADKVNGKYGNTSAYGNVGNPLLDLDNNDVRVRENRLQGSGFLEIQPVKWLTLRSAIGLDMTNSLNRLYNYAFESDESTFDIVGGNQRNPLSTLNVKETRNFRWVWDNTITFAKTFGDHDFTLLVGTTAEKYNRHWISALRKDVPADPNLWYLKVGDANTSQNDGSGDEWSRNSYLARLNYSYRGKYLFTGTIRTDGSSRLPGKNRWQQFPSFGVGWVLTKESFLANQNIFSLLKLRASYGKVGNDQIPTDAFTRVVAIDKPYPYTGSQGNATIGGQINQFVEPNITWEVTEEYDVAVEFGLFRSKLTGEVNYYDKSVDNALIEVPIPRTVYDVSGTIINNVASIQNRGLEMVLNWKERVNENLSFSIGGHVTFNKNTVVALNGGQAIRGGGIGAAQGFTTITDNGHPVGSFYVLKVLGVFNTGDEVTGYTNSEGKVIQPTAKPGDFKYWDKNNDGQIDDNDRDFAGSYQPVAYYGINLGVNWKNFDLSATLYGNAGNEVYNGKKAVRVDGRDNVEKDVVYNRWTSSNRSQTEPGANTGNLLASDYFVESGSFIRINNLTLGYALPGSILEKIGSSGFRIFLTSQNLFTYKKYSGFTSELPGDPISSGIELSSYPTTRTVAIGINVGF